MLHIDIVDVFVVGYAVAWQGELSWTVDSIQRRQKKWACTSSVGSEGVLFHKTLDL